MSTSSAEFVAAGRGLPAEHGWRWLADGWAFMSQARGTFIGMFALFVLISLVVGSAPLVGPLAMPLLTPVFNAGIVLGCDALRCGEPIDVGYLFAGFKRQTGRLVGLGVISILFGIAMLLVGMVIVGADALGALMSGGAPSPDVMAGIFVRTLLALLVILALSVPFYMALWFAAPLIVLNDYEIGMALKTSFAACLKNVMPYLVWGVAVIVLAVLATVPLALGWLLLGPLLFVSVFLSYRDVFYDERPV